MAKKGKGELALDEVEQSLMGYIGQYIYGTNEDTLEDKVGQLLVNKSLTLATDGAGGPKFKTAFMTINAVWFQGSDSDPGLRFRFFKHFQTFPDPCF